MQHDDHIWLTVLGEAWAIRAIEPDRETFHLWRGYEPDLEYLTVQLKKMNHAAYAEMAAAWLKYPVVLDYYRLNPPSDEATDRVAEP